MALNYFLCVEILSSIEKYLIQHKILNIFSNMGKFYKFLLIFKTQFIFLFT